jgi:hypothetical protein
VKKKITAYVILHNKRLSLKDGGYYVILERKSRRRFWTSGVFKLILIYLFCPKHLQNFAQTDFWTNFVAQWEIALGNRPPIFKNR